MRRFRNIFRQHRRGFSENQPNLCTGKGKANQELIKYLAKTLHESKGSFSLLSGETDRCKKIFLQTAHSPETEEKLRQMEKML